MHIAHYTFGKVIIEWQFIFSLEYPDLKLIWTIWPLTLSKNVFFNMPISTYDLVIRKLNVSAVLWWLFLKHAHGAQKSKTVGATSHGSKLAGSALIFLIGTFLLESGATFVSNVSRVSFHRSWYLPTFLISKLWISGLCGHTEKKRIYDLFVWFSFRLVIHYLLSHLQRTKVTRKKRP